MAAWFSSGFGVAAASVGVVTAGGMVGMVVMQSGVGGPDPVALSPTPQPVATAPESPSSPGAAQPPPPEQDAIASAPTPDPVPEAVVPALPAFDLVRVDADGNAVIAGRASANASVRVLIDGVEASQAVADPGGSFAALFSVPSSDTPRVLRLEMTAGGQAPVRSNATVILAPSLDTVARAPSELGNAVALAGAATAALRAPEPAETLVAPPPGETPVASALPTELLAPSLDASARAPSELGNAVALAGTATEALRAPEPSETLVAPPPGETPVVAALPSGLRTPGLDAGLFRVPEALGGEAEVAADAPLTLAAPNAPASGGLVADVDGDLVPAGTASPLPAQEGPGTTLGLASLASAAPLPQRAAASQPVRPDRLALSLASPTGPADAPRLVVSARDPSVGAALEPLPDQAPRDGALSAAATAPAAPLRPNAGGAPETVSPAEAPGIREVTTLAGDAGGALPSGPSPEVTASVTGQIAAPAPVESAAVEPAPVGPAPSHAATNLDVTSNSIEARPAPSEESTAPVVTAALAADIAPPAQADAGRAPRAETASAEPQPPAAPTVLIADDTGVRVLQPGGATPVRTQTVVIDTISYEPTGEVALGGRGSGEGFVRVYLNNRPIKTTKVGVDGQWRTPLPEVDTGVYTLRVDEIDADGTVRSRVETPFKREEPEVVAALDTRSDGAEDETGVVTVQPGNTLWGIATDRYGEGLLYVRVFRANQDRIRNPDLIYPGQVFTIPEAE